MVSKINKNKIVQRPHRLTEYVPSNENEFVDVREFGWVPPEKPLSFDVSDDKKFEILSRVGDDYSKDGKVREHRETEPCDFEAFGGRQPE